MPMTRRPSLPSTVGRASGRSADPLAGIGVGGIEAVVRLEPAESVGWTILSGKTMIASSPTSYLIEDARGQTIINGYLGLRAGYGEHVDVYVGYGRCFTGDAWQRDSFRAELRLIF